VGPRERCAAIQYDVTGTAVGALLVLDVGNEEPFISRTIEGAPVTGERVTEHLLDGQHRLTALWRGLHNNYKDRTYFLVLKTDEETGLPHYVDSIARSKREEDSELRPLWANKPKEQWNRRMIPLDLCAPDLTAPQRFRDWAKEATQDQNEINSISDQVWDVCRKFAAFNLPFLSLPITTKKQTALDVFIKMNTSASPLSTYDIVVAQVEAGMGKSLHDLVADAKTVCPNMSAYYDIAEAALYASALLQGRSPANATYLAKDFGPQALANWDKLISGMVRTVDFLEQERVFDAARLPTDVVVPVLIALWAEAPKGLDAEGSARNILRKYLWRAFFSNRYEKSTNSRALIDFNQMKPLVMGMSTGVPKIFVQADIFDDEQHPLPDAAELVVCGWPVRKDRLARAILALALKHGGFDLADGGTVTRTNLTKREYHHLFPAAHLFRLEYSGSNFLKRTRIDP
jgi:hypothetical protein